MASDHDEIAVLARPVHERCWCWQMGRCLTDCPTADHPRPKPLTDATWKVAAYALMGKADCFACGIRTNAPSEGERPLCSCCKAPLSARRPDDG